MNGSEPKPRVRSLWGSVKQGLGLPSKKAVKKTDKASAAPAKTASPKDGTENWSTSPSAFEVDTFDRSKSASVKEVDAGFDFAASSAAQESSFDFAPTNGSEPTAQEGSFDFAPTCDAAGESREAKKTRRVVEKITAFYQQHNPTKLDGLPNLLHRYAGKEDQMHRLKYYFPSWGCLASVKHAR